MHQVTRLFPDYMAPVVRNAPDGVRELAMLRWACPPHKKRSSTRHPSAPTSQSKGKDVDFNKLLRMEPDAAPPTSATPIASIGSGGSGSRAAVWCPFTSFSEFNKERGGDVWFAFDDHAPSRSSPDLGQLDIGTESQGGSYDHDLFGFLTTAPNDVVDPFIRRPCRLWASHSGQCQMPKRRGMIFRKTKVIRSPFIQEDEPPDGAAYQVYAGSHLEWLAAVPRMWAVLRPSP